MVPSGSTAFPFCTGLDSVAALKQKLTGDERSSAASQSLEALVCYRLMYRNWWRCGLHFNGHRAPVENGEPRDAEGVLSSEGSPGEDLWDVLLSEPHAALQSTQRALEAIQSRVASMIQHHGHLQVESGELVDERRTSEGSADPENR